MKRSASYHNANRPHRCAPEVSSRYEYLLVKLRVVTSVSAITVAVLSPFSMSATSPSAY